MKLTNLKRLVKEKERENTNYHHHKWKRGPYYRFYNIKNTLRYILNNTNQIWNCRRNGQIPWKMKLTKTDTGRNRESEDPHVGFKNWLCN